MRDKILARADRSGDCWLWMGYVRTDGYGVLTQLVSGRITPLYAHRLSYESFTGHIPDGYQIDHLCRVRHCVNPAHLEAVPPRINYIRGHGATGINARKTHCKHGHEFTPENTHHRPGGGRTCRTCARAKCRRRRAAAKEIAA